MSIYYNGDEHKYVYDDEGAVLIVRRNCGFASAILDISCLENSDLSKVYAERIAILLTISEGISSSELRNCIIAARPKGKKWK